MSGSNDKKDDIDWYISMVFPDISEEGEPIESICTLEEAIDTLSDRLSKNVVFEVESIEFAYKCTYSDDRTEFYAEPAWKIIAYNPNDELHYCVYIDAQTQKYSYISYSPF